MDSFTISVGNDVERRIRTPLQEAVWAVGGGTTRFAEAAKMPAYNLEYLLKLDRKALRERDQRRIRGGRIRSLTHVADAELIEDTVRKLGGNVPLLELLGVEPWQGPKRHGSDPNGKGSKPRTPEVVGLPTRDVGAAGGGTDAGKEARQAARRQRNVARASRQRHGQTPRKLCGIRFPRSTDPGFRQASGQN